MIDVAPSNVLRFHTEKVGILSLVALCSLSLPKIIYFYKCARLWQAKR